MKTQFVALALACAAASPLAAQEINTNFLSQNGWFSDDTRADGTGTEVAGTNLISDSLTDDPEGSASGTSAHDADILGQISFGVAPGTVPAGTHPDAVHLTIAPAVAAGKSQISHRIDDGTGHGPGSGFGPGFTAEYSWMGDGTVSVTASLKFGIKTADFGSTGVSSRTGENVWDKVLIYEPGNLNGGTSDSLWHTETIDYTTGKWWFFDRTQGASIIGTPMTLFDMSTSPIVVGTSTVAAIYAKIIAAGAHITSVQVGIGSGNGGGSVYVNQVETNVYRSGMTTTFGCSDEYYANDFEVDDFGWNVFGAGSESTRVASGTSGITSASGAWHCETSAAAAGNWGGYSGVCGCAGTGCAAPSDTFPTGGYVTSIDIYLDVDVGHTNNTRFDFSSAINNAAGSHRRDFIFNAGFYDDTDGSPGSGTNRFIVSASNNSQPGSAYAKNPARGPIAISTTGWYTFEHLFRNAGGILEVDMSIFDAGGGLVNSWTLSDVSDVIGSTVGGNRYGWFAFNEFSVLAFDNASRQPGPFDQNVTPEVIFGSGNINGSFTVDREDGVELGLRTKLRFDATGQPQNVFSSNGDGTYTWNAGVAPTQSFPTPIWQFEWSANTDYDDSTGDDLDDLTYELGLDFDPGSGTNYLAFDQITPGAPPGDYWDHALGDNTTPNGGGTVAIDALDYATLLSTLNVAQNSWRMNWFENPPTHLFDPTVPGFYEIYLAAFDGGSEAARAAITVIVVDGTSLTLEVDTCQQDQNSGTAGVQVEFELWLRNPDDFAVTGWQAFLGFNTAEMTYVGASSSYSPAPFGTHIQSIATAEVAAGELRLDGNAFLSPGTSGDALLATLVFTVDECDLNTVAFDLGQPFPSEVSNLGMPISTNLVDSSAVQGDNTPPVLAGTPANITQPSDAGACTGAVVTWTDPTATDNCDLSPTVACSPASGSFFPVGTTTVTCTATDECGNESTSTFDVTVTDTVLVDVVVELTGSGPTSRCIYFAMDTCGDDTSATLTFSGTAPAVATATIEVPCGVWTEICAKDEQHTKWDSSTLTLVGAKYVADFDLVLDAGDTDNDGDVDINDVTLFLGQFGNLASAGGCPWDGTTRDADFDNDGAVGSTDYGLLVPNWLTSSSCACSLSASIAAERRLERPLRQWLPVKSAQMRALDLHPDGRIDFRDVELFELMYGLSGELSRRMRATRR